MRDIHSIFYLPCEIRSSLRLEFQDPGICVGTLGIRKLWETFKKRFKRCGGGTQTSGHIRYPVLPACGVYKNNKSRFSAPRYSCKSQNVCIDICRYIYTNLGLHPMENSKCKPLQMKYVRRDHWGGYPVAGGGPISHGRSSSASAGERVLSRTFQFITQLTVIYSNRSTNSTRPTNTE